MNSKKKARAEPVCQGEGGRMRESNAWQSTAGKGALRKSGKKQLPFSVCTLHNMMLCASYVSVHMQLAGGDGHVHAKVNIGQQVAICILNLRDCKLYN